MLAVVLGTTTVEMKATLSLTTRGLRVLNPAQVLSQYVEFVYVKIKYSSTSVLNICLKTPTR